MLSCLILGVGTASVLFGALLLWLAQRAWDGIDADRDRLGRLMVRVEAALASLNTERGVIAHERAGLRSLQDDMGDLSDALDRKLDGHLAFEAAMKDLVAGSDLPGILPFKPSSN